MLATHSMGWIRSCCVGFSLSALGCAGVGSEVYASSAKYPVSLSPAVPDDSGHVLLEGRELEKVGTLSETYWRWSILYDSIEGEVDVSEDVNRAVQEHGGEAVVNLSVTSTECFLDWFVVLTWLPFWPTCAVVSVEGDVVRRSAAPKGRAAPAGRTASAPAMPGWERAQ